MNISSSPFSLTTPIAATSISWLSNKDSIITKEIFTRIVALTTITVLQAIDVIANTFILLARASGHCLNSLANKTIIKLDCHESNVIAHLKVIARSILGLFGSVIGIISPHWIINKIKLTKKDFHFHYAHTDVGLSPYFDKAYLLHLPNTERANNAFSYFSKTIDSSKIVPFSGIYGAKDPEKLEKELKQLGCTESLEQLLNRVTVFNGIYGTDNSAPKLGRLACFLGHYKIIDQINQKKEVSLVLEEDVCFTKEAPEIIKSKLPNLPEDWDIIYLGNSDDLETSPVEGNDHFIRVVNGLGALGYLVNGKSKNLPKILSILKEHLINPENIILPIDRLFARLQKERDFHFYGCAQHQQIVIQPIEESVIDQCHR